MISASAAPPEPLDPGLVEVLSLVRERRGIDFAGYRPSTVRRRIENRMAAVSAGSLGEYLQLLRSDPGEIERLTERLTIKVSRFFRNAEVFRRLQAIMLGWRTAAPAGERFRIWSAGCGNGEEPYSLAMLVSQLQGPVPAGSVLATDIDERALEVARRGCYGPESLDELPAALRPLGLCPSTVPARPHRVAPDIAAGVTFLHHDLTKAVASPASLRDPGFHLVCCRNVLIYLRPPVQERALHLIRRSLAPGGHLCLGEAEWPVPSMLPHLDVVDRSARIFRLKAGEPALVSR